MTTKNQAEVLGLGERKEMLAKGLEADLIDMHQQSLSLKWMMVKGRIVK